MQKLNFPSISIEVTKNCNLACKHCYACAKNTVEVSTIQIDALGDFFERFSAAGGRRVLLTGGEIFLVPEWKQIVCAAKKNGLMIDIFSNGTLITRDTANFVSENVNLINISLDGPEQHHDKLRRSPGSFQKTLNGLKLLQEYNAHIAIQCTITPNNIKCTDWLLDILEICKPIFVKLGHVSAMGRGATNQDLMLSDHICLKKLAIDYLERLNNFHTQVITNIITQNELKLFYPDFEQVVTPWILPNGNILSCYTDEHQDFWQISDIYNYPTTSQEKINRRQKLVKAAYQKAEAMSNFDLLQILNETAIEIAQQENC